MSELLIFDSHLSCRPYDVKYPDLFDSYTILPGDVGIICGDRLSEWLVLIGNAILAVPKSADVRVVSNKTD